MNTAGETYVLECSVGGMNDSKSVTYQWMDKEGSPITNGGFISITNSTSASYLQFSPLSQSHRGNYTCNATIAEATESISFYVSVNGKLYNVDIMITDTTLILLCHNYSTFGFSPNQ